MMVMTPQCNAYPKQPLLVAPSTSDKKKKKKSPKGAKMRRVKCVIVGDEAVGKTSLAVSYSNDSFPSEYVPTAFDNYNVEVHVNGKPIRVEICDTAGEDELNPLRHLCYPGADVFMLCFSLVRPSTLRSACTRWADELLRMRAGVVLVGTQSDLAADLGDEERLFVRGEALELAERLDAVYVETSAKACTKLKEAFDSAILLALERQREARRRRRGRRWAWLCCGAARTSSAPWAAVGRS